MPKFINRTLVVLILLAMFPPLLVARARALNSNTPPVHMIQDMDNQPKFRAQHENPMFADGRAMRPYPEGTIARGRAMNDEHFYLGLDNGKWATTFPAQVPPNSKTLARGRERYAIYCTPCHGETGDGKGIVSVRAAQLRSSGKATSWVDPKAVFNPVTMQKPLGELYNIVTNGISTMPAYGSQLKEADRWAIIAWVKALQRSQVASWDDLPPIEKQKLQKEREEAIRKAEQEAAEKAAEKTAEEAAQSNTNEGGS